MRFLLNILIIISLCSLVFGVTVYVPRIRQQMITNLPKEQQKVLGISVQPEEVRQSAQIDGLSRSPWDNVQRRTTDVLRLIQRVQKIKSDFDALRRFLASQLAAVTSHTKS